jgi:hypothetical protein
MPVWCPWPRCLSSEDSWAGAVGLVGKHHAQGEPVAVLDDLELTDVGVRGESGELERVHGHAAQRQEVVIAAVHGTEAHQRAPARAGLGVDRDYVGDLVADQRLNTVGEIGEEQPRAQLAGWHRLVVGIDILDDAELPKW